MISFLDKNLNDSQLGFSGCQREKRYRHKTQPSSHAPTSKILKYIAREDSPCSSLAIITSRAAKVVLPPPSLSCHVTHRTNHFTTSSLTFSLKAMKPSLQCLHLGDSFKAAMSRVSTQAMILTAGTAGSKSSTSALHGMTLSSVCSLSVHPTPLLLFNLHLPSYTLAALHDKEVMGIHVMPPTASAVTLGRKFAGGVKRDYTHFDAVTKEGNLFHEMTTPFRDIHDAYSLHDLGNGISVPVLSELEVVFLCRKKDVFEVDSHELWVVKVEDVLFPNAEFRQNSSGGLLYFQKGFHNVGDSLHEL